MLEIYIIGTIIAAALTIARLKYTPGFNGDRYKNLSKPRQISAKVLFVLIISSFSWVSALGLFIIRNEK